MESMCEKDEHAPEDYPARRTHYGNQIPLPCDDAFEPAILDDGLDVRLDRLKPCSLQTIQQPHMMDQGIRQITSETLHSLITGTYMGPIRNFYIIDCRFPYEHEGGHIRDAKNLWTMETLMDFFFYDPDMDLAAGDHTAIIFHCEFSAQRGPKQYLNLANIDKRITLSQDHRRLFPELYLLHKGYERYFERFPEDCTPQQYVTMKDARFKAELESSMNRMRKAELLVGRVAAEVGDWVDSSDCAGLFCAAMATIFFYSLLMHLRLFLLTAGAGTRLGAERGGAQAQ